MDIVYRNPETEDGVVLTEFEAARNNAFKEEISFDGGKHFSTDNNVSSIREGADWARPWVLKNDPIVKGLVETLKIISETSPHGPIDFDSLTAYNEAIKDHNEIRESDVSNI